MPDIYQGDELPFLALVDPDNRRPVDWELAPGDAAPADGRPPPDAETRKLLLILRLLALRARRPEVFPARLRAGRGRPEDVCAFLRGDGVFVVVVRTRDRRRGSADRPAEGRWRDVLRGEERSLGP